MSEIAPVCVLGLGLIGGSLLRAAGELTTVSGWSPSATTRAAAAADGFTVVDELDEALRTADRDGALVVLAAPLTAFGQLLGRVGELTPEIALTDVGSVKMPVADQVAELAPRARYVGSHPMAGTQHSGWPAGDPALFRGAAWVTCLTDDSDPQVWADVAALALGVGSRVVPADPADHDAAVARVSHLPHLLALALAQVGAESGSLTLSLAASSFADGTRVAATRPELIRAMCEGNREPLVDALDHALGLLGVARGSLASTGSLAKLTEAGHQGRLAFQHRADDQEEIVLSGDGMVDQLLAVGAAGGHVTELITRDPLTVRATYPQD